MTNPKVRSLDTKHLPGHVWETDEVPMEDALDYAKKLRGEGEHPWISGGGLDVDRDSVAKKVKCPECRKNLGIERG